MKKKVMLKLGQCCVVVMYCTVYIRLKNRIEFYPDYNCFFNLLTEEEEVEEKVDISPEASEDQVDHNR